MISHHMRTYKLHFIAMVAAILTASTYLGRSIVDANYDTIAFVIGMLILSYGYFALFIASLRKVALPEDEDKEAKKKDRWSLVGYILLATFYIGSIVIPGITPHIRFYDYFAAAGYGLMLIKSFVVGFPVLVAVLPLVFYYLFASIQKVRKSHDLLDRLQAVARIMFFVYYSVWGIGMVV